MSTGYVDPKRQEARQSYTGNRLTDSQFDEAWNITAIIHREIRKSGSFREKLTAYAHAFACNESLDPMRGETILRDIYSARHGESMNQTRKGLMEREAILRDTGDDQALHHARMVETLIQDGPTMPFYRAYDISAVEMARQHGVTESGAKSMMKEAFEKAEGRDFYISGKKLEEQYHRPVREAERASQRSDRQRQRTGPQM
ncbi:hypothetical protein [Ruegeria sp. HKCCD8929]|uniref:hypothetical protein n=1 Tax=Ruegeria sp. HKCCD8929 TaxID=2683006 RepID=UPI0014893D0C|nr:hypothetical protein [Ruegeria sp. HKCCD8929]